MSLFHENIRQILGEVEKFLNDTLKKESKLGKKTLEHKQLILDKIIKFYEENPQMKPVPSQDTISVKDGDETSLTGSSRSDESEDANYIDAGINVIAAADLKEPVLSGFLDKKQKKGTGLFGGPKIQKRWCVIHGGNFYYYSSAKDKEQNGAFRLEGYKFRNAPDITNKKAEKELCFELYHEYTGKRVYQFIAKNKTDYEEWQNVLENGGNPLIEEDIYDVVGAADSSSPGAGSVPVTEFEQKPVETVVEAQQDGEEYEDPDSALPPPPPPPSLAALHKHPKVPVPKIPKQEETTKSEPEPQEPDELYDDASSVEPLKKAEPPPSIHGRLPPPPPADTEVTPPELPPPVKRARPQRDLPPPPPEKKKIKLNITCKPEEDFENRFYGKWDCTADCQNELSFKKGDIIYILSKDFDEKSWWVGEMNGKFGLVPKNFLTPAYTLMA